ncbi:hypothetical protein Tco_0424628 [Tanacetum coccineum]
MHRTMRKSRNGTNIMHHLPMYPRRGKKSLTVPRQRRPNNSVTMTYEESRAKLKQQIVDTETSSSSNESRYDVRGTVGAGLRRARKLSQVATTCEESWSSRYDVRGTVGACLRRARNLGWSTTGLGTMKNLESDSQLHTPSGTKSLRRARNRRGRFTSCEEIWSSRYDVRGTVGAGLRRARKLGQVATTCEEPSGQVYVVRGKLVKSLDVQERRGLVLLTLRVTIGKSLRRARNQSVEVYVVPRNFGSSRYCCEDHRQVYVRARKLGQVASTCEETSGHVYVVRGNWSSRRTLCDETRAGLSTSGGILVRRYGSCENRRGMVYEYCGVTLVKVRYDVLRGTVGAGFTSCEERWSCRSRLSFARTVGAGLRLRGTLVKSLRTSARGGTVGALFTSCEETVKSGYSTARIP